MDNKLTLAVKEYAYSLGVDLCGVANIERYKDAPLKMSPQGILPTAKSVVVCAIHIPDAAIELGGEQHPQIKGPYNVQYPINDKLDLIAFKIARMLDDLGYKTAPIASSNIWRYRGFKELTENFAPDISHIYSAVCAGLGELGWNGLCITPEYGTRNRFISIITEAELTPTPLYNGEKICDMCGECIRNCPTNAYRKEVKGKNKIVVEGKEHVFCNKNLWRCAWGEHFDLDLDLEIPDVVDEKVILENVAKYGTRTGEFGVCVKVCLPKNLREWDTDYCKKCARRKRHVIPSDLPVHRQIYDKLLVHARRWDIDSVHFISAQTLEKANINIKDTLPDGVGAILITSRYQHPTYLNILESVYDYGRITRFNTEFTELDMCRELENYGYSAMPKSFIDHEQFKELCGVKETEGSFVFTAVVLTSAPLADLAATDICHIEPTKNLKEQLKVLAKEKGADLFGVASAKSINSITDQLKEIHKGETVFMAKDKNKRTRPCDAEITEQERVFNSATDFVKDARSVIVMGMHYPEGPVERVGKPPAESVGPYVFTQYEVNRLNGHLAYSICRALYALGYEAAYTFNLTGAGSMVGSPRGHLNNATSNALEAVAAGIGKMTLNGSVETEEYGIHQRFVAIVTNADLESDEVMEGLSAVCTGCERCINVCPTGALRKESLTEIDIDGKKVTYLPPNVNRCDWATKFALVSEDGNIFVGNHTNVPCPEKITAEKLRNALNQQDPMLKARPVTGEKCIINCPLGIE